MLTYMAKLGGFMFSVDTAAFQDLERASQYRWQGIERIGRKPAQQFLGPSADTITLNGVIHPHYAGGLGQIGSMRRMAGGGVALPLIYAFDTVGQFCGNWCIVSITEKRKTFFSNGAPKQIDFTINLTEYGDDNDAIIAAAKLDSSIAAASAPSLGTVNDALVSSSSALESSSASALASGATQAQGMAMAGNIGSSLGALSAGLVDTSAGTLATDAGKMLRSAVPGAWTFEFALGRLGSAQEAITKADSPVEMAVAMLNSAAAARSVYASATSISSVVRNRLNDFNGKSVGALYRNQSDNIARAFDDIAGSSDSITKASKNIWGVLNV